MTQNHYDTIIIGAGHNGLVAAAYLAKQGKKVLVLERRDIVGGQVVTESFGDGFTVDSLHAGGTLRPDIIKDLKLSLPASTSPTAPLTVRAANSGGTPVRDGSARRAFISLQPDSNHLILDPDPAKAAEAIRRFSEKDAANWVPFLKFMKKASQFIESANSTIMPRLPKNFSFDEGYGLAELGLDLRLMGGADLMRIVRGIPMTAEEFVDEWFESDVVKAAVASLGIHGFTLGVMGAGTGYTLMHNWANRGGMSHLPVQGGIGNISEALAGAVRSSGGEIRTNAEVKQVTVKNMRATGVILSNGEEISANILISAADPKHTFLQLVGAMELPPEFVWNVQSIKMRGSVAKVHLLTNGNHGIPEGTVALAPSIKYLEKAYDAAKYHQISEKPYLEVTSVPVRESAKESVISIHFQFAAYNLKDGDWKSEGSKVEKTAIETLAEYFPDLKSSIVNTKTLTPLDLERTYGLTEGDLNHGQIMLDQFMFMRPIPGWSNHKTPIDNLYLCGSGVHGGGGISGAAGRNVLKVLK
jgi:phytoene dehydrogenase-like protein